MQWVTGNKLPVAPSWLDVEEKKRQDKLLELSQLTIGDIVRITIDENKRREIKAEWEELIPRLNGKTIIVKDLDPASFGELRNLYAGVDWAKGPDQTVVGVFKPWGNYGKPVWVSQDEFSKRQLEQMRKRREFAERCWKARQLYDNHHKKKWIRLGLLVAVIGLFVALWLEGK